MGNKIHTVTCPDGSVFTRETTGQARRFYFLIAVERTQAEIDHNVATDRAKIAKNEKLVAELTPVAESAEGQAAYAAAKARRDYLDEEVEETRDYGHGPSVWTGHRWLSQAYSGVRASGYTSDKGYNDARGATDALEATAVDRLRVARAAIASATKDIAEELAHPPGKFSEHSWSQTAANADKAANKAIQYRLGARAHVIPVTDAMVRERATRAKKAA